MLEKNELSATTCYETQFTEKPFLIVSAPGRINFIGEHTDYNEGFVLPAAIDIKIYAAIGHRHDDLVRIYAEQFDELFEIRLSDIKPIQNHWANYVIGVLDQLLKKGLAVHGFNIVISGNIPVGAGLSSSAAVECATIIGMNDLFSFGLTKIEMALIAQKSEHIFANVQCGIMDQYASLFGKKDFAMKLDCRSLTHDYVHLPLEGYSIILINSHVKHELSNSEYNTRKSECEQGVELVRKYHPEIKSLRDVTIAMIDNCINDYVIHKRCKYVIKENLRLHAACDKLNDGDVKGFGEIMYQTHEGLQHEYNVSCPELDLLVDLTKGYPGVAGARMMGGGFGGCTINIVRNDAVTGLIEFISSAYRSKMNKISNSYIVKIAEGAISTLQNN